MKFDKKTGAAAGKRSSRRGIPNRATVTLRDAVHTLLDDNYHTIVADLKKLKPKERVDAWCRLLEYALPKLQRSEVSIDISKLSDGEIDALLNRALEKLRDND